MKHKGFVIVNLMVSLAILFALVGAVGGLGFIPRQSALAAQSRAMPEITGVEPASAPNDVDTTITISGENFEETAVVYLGGLNEEGLTINIFLPLVLKNFPLSPPEVTILNKIDNPDGENDYTVSWSSSENALSYTLQEDDNNSFSSPTIVYEGPNTSKAMTGKSVGTYYYRVRAENSGVQSDWSNVQSVAVTVPLEPEEWKIISRLGYADQASLDLDSLGRPHISYANGPSVYYEFWDGNDWVKEKVDESSSAPFYPSASLAIGKNDQPQIAYPYIDPRGFAKIAHAEWDGTSWQKTYLGDFNFPSVTNIALKSNDDPCISFEADWATIYYTCRTGGSWGFARDVGVSKLPRDPYAYHSLAIADDDTLHFSYCSYGTNLKYATLVDGSLERTTIDGQGTGTYSSIALDNQNYPHISYYDYESETLKYARWDGSQWQIETVDDFYWGYVGQFTSIALDKQDRPHISYIDGLNRYLKYAYWDGSQWQITVIDEWIYDYREFTSLALDDYGFVHIVYKESNLSLTYATNSNFPGE